MVPLTPAEQRRLTFSKKLKNSRLEKEENKGLLKEIEEDVRGFDMEKYRNEIGRIRATLKEQRNKKSLLNNKCTDSTPQIVKESIAKNEFQKKRLKSMVLFKKKEVRPEMTDKFLSQQEMYNLARMSLENCRD